MNEFYGTTQRKGNLTIWQFEVRGKEGREGTRVFEDAVDEGEREEPGHSYFDVPHQDLFSGKRF